MKSRSLANSLALRSVALSFRVPPSPSALNRNQSIPDEPVNTSAALSSSTVAPAAQQPIVAGSTFEAVVAAVAIEPHCYGRVAGHLDIVIAAQAMDDQPSGWTERADGSAIERNCDFSGVVAFSDNDLIVAVS